MALRKGSLLKNRYRIKHISASDGETVLYQAHDQRLDIDVGIKESRISTPAARENVTLEINLFAPLRHPNLMRITDHFEIEGQTLYQVTDFVDARSVLDPSIYPDGMPYRQVIPIILPLCDALYYLHNNQPPIVHGEINLDTITLSPNGQVILILPRWIVSGGAETKKITAEDHSSVSTVQTDISDLGRVVLQMLTNKPAAEFTGSTSMNLLQEVLAQADPSIPESISMVIAKALTQDPKQCFQRIEDFKAALLNSLIFMPPETAAESMVQRLIPLDLPVDDAIDDITPEEKGSPTLLEPAPQSTTPIRRRVPWGLLGLGLLITTAVYYTTAIIN